MHAFQLTLYIHSIILCYTFVALKCIFVEALQLINVFLY